MSIVWYAFLPISSRKSLNAMGQHPLRRDLVHELHARPFPETEAGSSVVMIAIIPGEDVFAALFALLAHYKAPLPAEGVNQHNVDLGPARLKWERHSEFVTYTLIRKGLAEPAFSGALHDYLPADWLLQAGEVITSVLVRIEGCQGRDDEQLLASLDNWFQAESLSVSAVGELSSLVASDFRLDAKGHVRIAIMADAGLNPLQLGRLVQRLLEIEVYKSMAMLSLPTARDAAGKLGNLETRLTSIVQEISDAEKSDQETLDTLLAISTAIQNLSANTSFRFSAAIAYETIVNQRLSSLEESRFHGRQQLSEFMRRRFDPAMRTCQATEKRLSEVSKRATRASNLLRTRVDVAAERQSQALLDSMNVRAEQQLRLQETVEGLSVVAISYYAVSLLGYVVAPLADALEIKKSWLLAGLSPAVIIGVLLMLRATHRRLHRQAER